MNEYFIQGTFYFNTREYTAAAEFFAKAYRDGYKCQDSLYWHGKCKFLAATFQMNGLGNFIRRSTLISAARALEDSNKHYGLDYDAVAELCCVEYALGLMHRPKNGFTSKYNEYFEILERKAPDRISGLQEFLPKIEAQY